MFNRTEMDFTDQNFEPEHDEVL
eukprot:SAG31_NODE_22076_length_534_cov_1.222989_1_plen_22_part_10